MSHLLEMEKRPNGFLDPDKIDKEVFNYIRELHEILWRFVRAEYPNASGSLNDWLPTALAKAEKRTDDYERFNIRPFGWGL